MNLLNDATSGVTRFDKLTRFLSDHNWRRLFLGVLALCALAAIFTSPAQRAEAHQTGICASKHWCENRTHTCGPVGGYGKCLMLRYGGQVCAEILFQVAKCSQCQEPNCTNCMCVMATGADRCNNGVNGYPYICVRRVAQ